MKEINIPTVSLPSETIHRIAFSEKAKKYPFWYVDNILTDDGYNLLLEDGGAIVLSTKNN